MTRPFSPVCNIALTPPSLEDNTGDADRLVRALKKRLQTERIHMDLPLLRRLPRTMRNADFHLRCLTFKDRTRHILLDVRPASDETRFAGLAVDLGTTRVVLRLIDLGNGEILGESAFHNPQISVAPDVLARIHHADTSEGLDHLRKLIIDGLNEAMKDICPKAGLSPGDIHLISVAGNTAMTHLFLGVPPRWIIREPYIPPVNAPEAFRARELGILASEQARVIIFPNVGSYFGGDLIAGILFSGMNRLEEPAILVDVGTNAEVILGNRDWLVACAGAAGPALESGVARMGTMAGPGVIDTVTVDRKTREIQYRTIEDLPPAGMCGSGIIDLAAHLFLSGMLDIRGKLVPDACGDRLKTVDGMPFFVVVPAEESATGEELGMHQADMDSLIRSKAAMYTILRTITLTVGLELNDLSTFYVAGTFGSFIKPESAIAIGMIPDLPLSSYRPLGNSSLGGASSALTHPDVFSEIDAIRDRITYIELNVNQELMNRFSAAKFLPHTNPARFPSVKVWGDR